MKSRKKRARAGRAARLRPVPPPFLQIFVSKIVWFRADGSVFFFGGLRGAYATLWLYERNLAVNTEGMYFTSGQKKSPTY